MTHIYVLIRFFRNFKYLKVENLKKNDYLQKEVNGNVY